MHRSWDALTLFILALASWMPFQSAWAENVLYAFTGGDGANPSSGVIKGPAGVLYGTTDFGGMGCSLGCGTIFKLTRDGREKVLHTFTNGSDGSDPAGPLISDSADNLYGEAAAGGSSGHGTAFNLSPNGTLTVLYAFTDRNDGGAPTGGLIMDNAGNLYGTASQGGANGKGAIFEISVQGSERALYAFKGGSDGANPYSGVILDGAGNLYGTTVNGGSENCQYGCGTVFRLAPGGNETVLYAFTGGADGSDPFRGLVRDKNGNLYGTTLLGGGYGYGAIFKLAPDGTETVLHSFSGGNDGANPYAGLIRDSAGFLYGTTTAGGANGKGAVFQLAPDGTLKVLHSFTGGKDGTSPYAGLIRDKKGHLYGTTYGGGGTGCNGTGCGTVFKLRT